MKPSDPPEDGRDPKTPFPLVPLPRWTLLKSPLLITISISISLSLSLSIIISIN